PQQPPAANTTYHVRFDITVGGQYVTNEWNFSTGTTVSGGGQTSTSTDSGLHSAWTSQTAMPMLQPAATSPVTLMFRNTGTKTWTKGVAGSQVALGVAGDGTAYSAMGMNGGWPSPNRVAVQNEPSVAPGGTAARLGVNLAANTWAGLSVNWPFTTRPAIQTEASVAPGTLGTFTFQVKAPPMPGLYAIHLRPVIDGVTWMEDEGVFLYVTVTN